MYGKAILAVSDVKEMKVTDEYLGLDEKVRKCQNDEPFENCTSRQYIENVKKQCGCVPYALRDFTKENSVDIVHKYTRYL